MEIQRNSLYAVIIGDIVQSSKLQQSERVKLPDILNQAYSLLKKHFPEILVGELSIFRGDSWQMLINNPNLSLRLALIFRTFIKFKLKYKYADSRLAIAIGTISFLPEENISMADGEAFKLAGHSLEKIPAKYRMSFNSKILPQTLNKAVDLLVKFVDSLVIDWTKNQAQAISKILLGFRQSMIAKNWEPSPITQQAVSKHLISAKWYLLNDLLNFYEKIKFNSYYSYSDIKK